MIPIQVLCLSSNPIFYTRIQLLIESESNHITWGGCLCPRLPVLPPSSPERSTVIICDDPAIPALTQHLHPRNNPAIYFLIYTLTHHLEDYEYFRTLGFRGIITTLDPLPDLLIAIRKISQQQWWFPSSLVDKIFRHYACPPFPTAPPPESIYNKLRPSDLKLLRCLIQLPNCKCHILADTLSLSERTIRNHLSNLYKRLGVHSRDELLALLHHSNVTLEQLTLDRFHSKHKIPQATPTFNDSILGSIGMTTWPEERDNASTLNPPPSFPNNKT